MVISDGVSEWVEWVSEWVSEIGDGVSEHVCVCACLAIVWVSVYVIGDVVTMFGGLVVYVMMWACERV